MAQDYQPTILIVEDDVNLAEMLSAYFTVQGYRTLIAYQTARRSAFLYGFAKSERDNIDAKRMAELKILSRRFVT